MTLNSSNNYWKQESKNVTLWEIDIHPAAAERDVAGAQLAIEARDLGLGQHIDIAAAHGFLLQGDLSQAQVQRAAEQLLVDAITERAVVAQVGDPQLAAQPARVAATSQVQIVQVLPKPGVMDPVAQSTLQALVDMGLPVDQVTTFHKYWLSDVQPAELERMCQRLLANDSIERVLVGPLTLTKIDVGADYQFALQHVPIRTLDDEQLLQLSKQGQLYLTLTEMQTIQRHFQSLDREPTDIELETIAQTWSEHCSHKTLAGRIAYTDEQGTRQFTNMLKETIFAGHSKNPQAELGADDWCVKVFSDNAGIVKFDEDYHVVFKVETHNHPSAIEPYGGANTGIGGVIRDPMGTGLGAKPFCNTDIFCFAPPDTDPATLPPGVIASTTGDERCGQRCARLW
jgi:phosphoribosylformylglycinamidine synthase subunit PurSL